LCGEHFATLAKKLPELHRQRPSWMATGID
jgi:hypothetical protein